MRRTSTPDPDFIPVTSLLAQIIDGCPPNNDDWTDEDEMRAAGHPAAQAVDYSEEPTD
jgi:hypothetical protein